MLFIFMQLEFPTIELVIRGANGAIQFERVQLRSELLNLNWHWFTELQFGE